MGSKNKLKRFKENETFKNVIQPERAVLEKDAFALQGTLAQKFFKNDHPIVLELGCGKGEYTLHLADQNPERNYIGIDIKGARFWRCQNSPKGKSRASGLYQGTNRVDRHLVCCR